MHWLRYTAVVVVLVLVAAVLWMGTTETSDELPVNTRLGGDAELVAMDGEPFHTSQLRGQVVLLFFGYTHCPDICPATLARMTQAWKTLAEEGHGDQVRIVFVTFDPERDTPGHLREYLGFFGERVLGLTGSPEQIRSFAEKYGVVFMKDEATQEDSGPVLFTHSDFVYLIDREGRVRKLYPSDAEIDRMVKDAQSLL